MHIYMQLIILSVHELNLRKKKKSEKENYA